MKELNVVAIETRNLGDRSYVIGGDEGAIVIDPQRDIDRVQSILDEHGWQATHVLETHFHNDYVSGGLELARRTGADYVVPDGMHIEFTARRVKDDDVLASGLGSIRVLHTPGHTPNHVSFSINRSGEDIALFTGGSLLFGSVGRPDLLGPALTEPLARAQWASMHRLPQIVTHTAQVYPTHGFGSFCSATATVGTASTLMEQMTTNPVFHTDEETFVRELIAGLDAFPRYYAHMGPANQSGAGPIDLSLPRVATSDEIAAHLLAGDWIVDLRQRRVFAADHLRGAFSFDVRGNAVTYLGWLIDWGTPLVLLGENLDEVEFMQRELVRIGIDRPVAYSIGTPADWVGPATRRSSYPRATHADMAAALAENPSLPMVDLRRRSECENGYVQGARLVPLHELPSAIDDLVAWGTQIGQPAWLYCGSGFRASIAASMLEAAGMSVIHVDDDFPNAAKAGLPIVVPGASERLGDTYAD